MLATKPLDKLSHRQGQGKKDLKEGIDTVDVVLYRYKNDQVSYHVFLCVARVETRTL